MTTFTVNIDNRKTEKAMKAFMDALEIKYDVNNSAVDDTERPLTKKEQKLYNRLKGALQDIKRWENGEIELRDAREMLNEL